MFPETFVEKHLAASPHSGVVFDPFCGRGTTVFQSLLQGRDAAGSDLNPVAACISGAKCDPPERSDAETRLSELRQNFRVTRETNFSQDFRPFFELCFHKDTLEQILYLRSEFNWRGRKDDRFLAALCLGALHGESHRSPNYFSNRMPRTISTKPSYSVRWWRQHGYEPPSRDVFEILERMIDYRFRSRPPEISGTIRQLDARLASHGFPKLVGQVTDVITSPPYLDTTNYREDQWLRSWFLGDKLTVPCDRGDDRHYSKELYWDFLRASWQGLGALLAKRARLVVRVGGRHFQKDDLRAGLLKSLKDSLGRNIRLMDDGVSSEIGTSQATAFRGAKTSRLMEHDFCFSVSG